jgi:hypothetical protein
MVGYPTSNQLGLIIDTIRLDLAQCKIKVIRKCFLSSPTVRDQKTIHGHRVWAVCMCPAIGTTYKSTMSGNTKKSL